MLTQEKFSIFFIYFRLFRPKLQAVFAHNSRSAVILADITVTHGAHLLDFSVVIWDTVHIDALQVVAQ